MELITSKNNPKIKNIRALRQRKQRKQLELFVVEGLRHLGEALESDWEFDYLIFADELIKEGFAQTILHSAEKKAIPLIQTTPEIMHSLSDKDQSSGILAVVKQRNQQLASYNPSNFSWGLVLVSPQDPGNLGTILRSTDAVGADGIIVITPAVDMYHPSAVRASMGALFTKPVIYSAWEEFSKWANSHSYHNYGSSAQGTKDYTKEIFSKPALLLVGNEREGLHPKHIEICETLIKLPMHGNATSLNLSVATGVLLYQMLTRFKGE